MKLRLLNRKIGNLELQQDTLEQYDKKHNLVISGITEHEDKDLEEVVKELGDLLNVSIDQEEIILCIGLEVEYLLDLSL